MIAKLRPPLIAEEEAAQLVKERSEREATRQAVKELLLKSAEDGRLAATLPEYWRDEEKDKQKQAEIQQRAAERQKRADEAEKARLEAQRRTDEKATEEIAVIRRKLAVRARVVQAAVRIQSYARGLSARKETAVMWGSATLAQEATSGWIFGIESQVAATQIQCAARQKTARKKTAEQRKVQEAAQAARLQTEECNDLIKSWSEQALQTASADANAAEDELASSATSLALQKALRNAEVREVTSAQSARNARRLSASRGSQGALRHFDKVCCSVRIQTIFFAKGGKG